MRDPDPDLAGQPIDLTNCDREPIHIPGKIQYFGCLIALSSDWVIAHASANCGAVLGLEAERLGGLPFNQFFPPETIHALRTRMQALSPGQGVARLFAFPLLGDGTLFDVSIHSSGPLVVLEFEPRSHAQPRGDAALVQSLIARVRRHETIDGMANEAARGLRMLSGFDRVMVYRFEEDDSGTVIAEAARTGLETFLGLRYPASDIPKQARALYVKSPLRLIADVDGECFPIIPERMADGAPLDLSLAVTRAVSPIHLEYLRNMGVAASMSVSIIRQGRLWGLFACHHYSPFYIGYEKRSEVELFAQLFNYELAQAEMAGELAETDRARTLHDRLMTQVSSGLSLLDGLESVANDVGDVIPFDGIAIWSNGHYRARGAAPSQEEFIGLARFLNTTQPGQIYVTDNIAARYAGAESFSDRAAGLLALPVSRAPRDYIVLFRRELAQTVKWAGNPDKPVEATGPHGARLTPRKSFEIWNEVVKGRSAPWKAGERRAADILRVTLLEVVLKMADETNTTRKRAQEQQELLIAELNHRVRNILSLIRSLVGQGRGDAGSVEAYAAVLDARIHALARAHDQLTRREWRHASLKSLIENEVKAFLSAEADRVFVRGENLDLSPQRSRRLPWWPMNW